MTTHDTTFTGAKVSVTYRTLSDGSRAYAVRIKDEDGQEAAFECKSESAASKAMGLIYEAIEAARV